MARSLRSDAHLEDRAGVDRAERSQSPHRGRRDAGQLLCVGHPAWQGHFFIELDRGTETIYRAWQQKVLAYKAYWRSGKLGQRYEAGEPATSFRVLTICPSQKRAANIISAAQQYGSLEAAGLFLAAPITKVDPQALIAPIWVRGGFSEP
jgi:hypothetical protein